MYRSVLAHWRIELGAASFVSAADMPQSGHSETASAAIVPVSKAIETIEGAVARLS